MITSNLTIKVIVFGHFFLSVWGSMGNYMPSTYIYVNAGVLACGLWAIAMPQAADAVLMTLVTLVFSILEDIILLALYEPRGYDTYEAHIVAGSSRHEYRFALGMAVLNLILKPFSAVLLYRIMKSGSGDGDFAIPGIDRLPGVGGGNRGGYSDIDHNPESPAYAPVSGDSSPPPGGSGKE